MTHHGVVDASGALAWVAPVGVLLLLLIGHALAIRRAERRRARRWPVGRRVAVMLGLTLIITATTPPVVEWAAVDPRGHMAQHLLLGMFGPVAIVLGAPMTLVLAATPTAVARRVTRALRAGAVRVLSHPLTAGLLHVVPLYVLYLTPLHDVMAEHAVVAVLVGVHMVAAGLLFAWALAGPDPAPHRPGPLARLGVLVVAGSAHGILATVLYARTEGMSATAALPTRQAAQWMYYGGDLVDLVLATAILSAWYRARARRERGLGQAALPPGLPIRAAAG